MLFGMVQGCRGESPSQGKDWVQVVQSWKGHPLRREAAADRALKPGVKVGELFAAKHPFKAPEKNSRPKQARKCFLRILSSKWH